jgi:tetratricopeptide (TPR) repeat protein
MSGRLDEGFEELRRGLEFYPESADLHNNLGRFLLVKGQLDEGQTELEQAVSINPDLADAQARLGKVLAAEGHLEEASVHFEEALRLSPQVAEVQNDLGVALFSLGKSTEALPHFQKAVEIDPQFAEAHCYLGMVLYHGAGRVQEALSQWRETLNLEPDNALAMSEMARALSASPQAEVRNDEEALKLAREAVRLSGGQDAEFVGTLAIALANAGQFQAALDTAHRALQLATQQNQSDLIRRLNSEIRNYEAGQPYRDAWIGDTSLEIFLERQSLPFRGNQFRGPKPTAFAFFSRSRNFESSGKS